jgi:hypothetical protein
MFIMLLFFLCVTDMPRQKTPSTRMDFFEEQVFHGGDNAMLIEATSVVANVPNSSGNIEGIF